MKDKFSPERTDPLNLGSDTFQRLEVLRIDLIALRPAIEELQRLYGDIHDLLTSDFPEDKRLQVDQLREQIAARRTWVNDQCSNVVERCQDLGVVDKYLLCLPNLGAFVFSDESLQGWDAIQYFEFFPLPGSQAAAAAPQLPQGADQ